MNSLLHRGALLALGLAWPSASLANGRFPAAQHVVVGPGAASTTVALRTTFGIALSLDGGRSFRWLCEEAMLFPFVPAQNFDAPVEVPSRGGVVFGYELGVRHSADGCKADDVRAARMRSFSDLTSDPSGRVVYAVQADQGMANAVYRGDGDSMEFERVGAGVTDVLFDTIEVAPSNPMRLYLTGRGSDSFAPLLYRSDDGGATLTRVMSTGGAAADSLWVSGVDPRDPDTLYVRASMGLGTELRRSRDGGRTFERLVATGDPMLGFAMSDDGRTLWVGSIAEGLLRSDDGGASFRAVNRFPVLCLRQHAGTLWACSDMGEPRLRARALGRRRPELHARAAAQQLHGVRGPPGVLDALGGRGDLRRALAAPPALAREPRRGRRRRPPRRGPARRGPRRRGRRGDGRAARRRRDGRRRLGRGRAAAAGRQLRLLGRGRAALGRGPRGSPRGARGPVPGAASIARGG